MITGQWISLATAPQLLQSLPLSSGQAVEVTTSPGPGQPLDGTALFTIMQVYPPDGTGVYAEAKFMGASVPLRAMELDVRFPQIPGVPAAGMLHFCRGASVACNAPVAAGRQLHHVDLLRFRSMASISDSWSRYAHQPGGPSGSAGGGAAALAGLPDNGGAAAGTGPIIMDNAAMKEKIKELRDKLRGKANGDGSVGGNLAVQALKEIEKGKKKKKRKGTARRTPALVILATLFFA